MGSGRPFGAHQARPPHDIEHLAERLDALLSSLAAGVLEADLEGRIRYVNAAALRILNVPESALVGKTPNETGIACYDESGARIMPDSYLALAQLEGTGASVRAVLRAVRPPSPDVWLDAQIVAMRSVTGEVLGTVASFLDVTERFRSQAREQAAVRRMNDVLQSMAAGVLLVDAEGRIEYANSTAAGLSGLKPEDVVGQLAADPAWQLTDETGAVVPYEALPVPTALRERREVRGVELGVPTLAGVTRWMRVSAQPLFEADGTLRGAVVTTEDVTERHNLAEQLAQAQKIEGIGQLAGGMAHDFNNLLTVILGNAELALLRKPQSAVKEVTEIRDAANRGASLTRQLLTFARKQVVQAHPVHLDRLTDAVEGLLHRALGEGIVLQRASDAELWPIRIDPGQMEQVLVNLAINARDAMPRGGSLVLELRNTTVDAREAQQHTGVEPGDFVLLSMTDSGTGISRELVTRIFEPFFTTKPLGSGTGLGLSICYGVVKQARGFIGVETELGRGTTFKIYLPRCVEQPSEAAAGSDAPPERGKATILLVEDQDSVRSLVERTLTGYGYKVVSASGGRHALVLQQQTPGIDMVITDMVMPEMGGADLASLLQQRAPGLPVLYMTGYVDARSPALFEADAEESLLLKPFTPMQLLQRVQLILSRVANG